MFANLPPFDNMKEKIMSGCHVPQSNQTRMDVLENRVDKIEEFVFYPAESQVPEVMCDKCHGKGTLVDDGIL